MFEVAAPSNLPLKGEAYHPDGKSYPLGEDLGGALSSNLINYALY